MIFKLFLNDLNSFLSEIYEKTIYYEKKKKGSSQILVQNQCSDFERTCSSKVSY